jgi:putative ABC transport system permease protein
MTRGGLVFQNLLRNRRRTLLTFLSVATSLALLTGFCAVYRYFSSPLVPPEFRMLLMVWSGTSIMIPLPLRYGERIRAVPGVAGVTPINIVDGLYGGQDELLWALAFDPETFFKVYTDWHLPDEQRVAFTKERTAAVAGRKTAKKFGWKLGDRIHLRSPSYNVTLDLTLRGIYTSEDESMTGIHWDYLNEMQGRPNKPEGFWVRVRSADEVPGVMQAIDSEFRNSEVETRTQPMGQMVLDFLATIGNIKLILICVSAAVLFAILLVVANTMGMSIRERTAELAVLRALGFRSRQVLGMLAAESLVISLAGALAGCLATTLILALTAGYRFGGAMPISIQVDRATVALVLGVAVAVSLASTLIPAYRASRVSIAEALRFVG